MFSIFLFILGTTIGSFLNVLIDRLPNEQKITGRSQCDYCRHQLSGLDLIPIISFLALGGRCRYCQKKLSIQYPLIEILTGISFILILNSQFSPQAIFNEFSNFKFQISNLFTVIAFLGITSSLIVIFFSDLKYHLISDYILLAFFLFSVLLHLPEFHRLPFYLFSGVVVAAPIFLIYYLTKERAMGLGDVYLAAIIGFLLGIKSGLIALYFGFIIGAVVGLILILLKQKKLKSKVAFGPFLVLGVVIMLFFQQEVFQIVNKIYGF